MKKPNDGKRYAKYSRYGVAYYTPVPEGMTAAQVSKLYVPMRYEHYEFAVNESITERWKRLKDDNLMIVDVKLCPTCHGSGLEA